MTMSLERLLRPRSIAVMGGSWAHNVVEQSLRLEFDGVIWPVHPQRKEVHGLPCYRKLEDLPSAPDATFIGINRFQTVASVRTLAAMGAGGAVCFAAGFGEASGEDDQAQQLHEQLLLAAGDMPLIGPNCYGMINYLDGALLWPDQHGGVRTDRGVALITQSSNIAINLTMQTRGLPIAYVLTAGNQAQLSLGELGAAVLHDERVTALGLHIEGFGDLAEFEQLAAAARRLKKPIVVVKAGKSRQAQRAMLSHTNSLSGSDAAAAAFLSRLGIARLGSLSVMLETLKLLHVVGPLTGTQLQSMSCSGGEASLMADAVAGSGLTFPVLEEGQRTELHAALGPLVALANPLDYHTFIWGDVAAMTATFTAMLRRRVDLSLLVLDFPRGDRCEHQSWHTAIAALQAARDATGATVGILSSLPENLPEVVALQLMQAGMVPLSGIDDAVAAIEAAVFIGTSLAEAAGPVLLQLPHKPASVAATATALHTSVVRRLLSQYDLSLPDSWPAASFTQLDALADRVDYPVVLKATGIDHKTEAGAVQLNLCSSAELRHAAICMQRNIEAAVKTGIAPANWGFVVESMVSDSIAELLVGIVRDSKHGLMLTLAAGGVLAELLADATQLLLPVNETQVKKALQSLKLNRLLRGYRGGPAADLAAIVRSIMQLQQLALDNATHLQELEINPLMCRANDVVVVDALISMTGVNAHE